MIRKGSSFHLKKKNDVALLGKDHYFLKRHSVYTFSGRQFNDQDFSETKNHLPTPPYIDGKLDFG